MPHQLSERQNQFWENAFHSAPIPVSHRLKYAWEKVIGSSVLYSPVYSAPRSITKPYGSKPTDGIGDAYRWMKAIPMNLCHTEDAIDAGYRIDTFEILFLENLRRRSLELSINGPTQTIFPKGERCKVIATMSALGEAWEKQGYVPLLKQPFDDKLAYDRNFMLTEKLAPQ